MTKQGQYCCCFREAEDSMDRRFVTYLELSVVSGLPCDPFHAHTLAAATGLGTGLPATDRDLHTWGTYAQSRGVRSSTPGSRHSVAACESFGTCVHVPQVQWELSSMMYDDSSRPLTSFASTPTSRLTTGSFMVATHTPSSHATRGTPCSGFLHATRHTHTHTHTNHWPNMGS